MRRLTNEEFVKRAREVHGNKYEYSKVEYINNRTHVLIICNFDDHGRFFQSPSNHLYGKGCPKCSSNKASKKHRSTVLNFIKKAKSVHGVLYDYSNVKYKNNYTDVYIKCKKHGLFSQKPNNHIAGKGCPKCGIDRVSCQKYLDNKEFIKRAKKVYGNKYDYSKIKYKDSKTKIIIICKKHGEFYQRPDNHLTGKECPYCVNKNEGKIKELLLKYFGDWHIMPHKKIWNKYKNYNYKRYCDFWMEKNDKKVIVEYDGRQHFEPVRFNGMSIKKAEKEFEKTKIKDKLDKEFCEENGIALYRIKYTENKEKSVKRLFNKLHFLAK